MAISMILHPPRAAIVPFHKSVHGVEWVDEYSWIKSENWREVLRHPEALPSETLNLLEAENAYTDAVLAPTQALRAGLVAEMRGRIKEDESEAPQPDGPFAYYARYRHGAQHRLFCRRPREGGPETVLLDADELARGQAFFRLHDTRQSPDHRLVAWSADVKGSELYDVFVRDVASGRDGADIVSASTGEIVWASDSLSFFYVRLDDNHRPCAVLRHRLGDDSGADAIVFEEPDPAWFVGIGRSRSGAYCIISIHGHDASETRVVDLVDINATPRLIAARQPGVRYDVVHHGAEFFIRANSDGASDFKIMAAPVADPSPQNWREVEPHRPGRLILGLSAFRDFLVRIEREDGLPRIVIRALPDGDEHAIAFAQEAYVLGLETVFEFDSPLVRFSFSSMTTPREVYDYDMAARTRTLVKRQEVQGGFDAGAYVTRRIFARADDGEMVPISLLHRADTPIDGTAPLLAYGYGAYGHAIDAAFSSNRLSLVDRGFVYAILHVRGGTDKGWRWYEQGKLAHKTNTFTDFLSATRSLIEKGYAAPGRVIAHGGSAGGMLMGAIANMAPSLYAGVIADVPFVDVLNTMLDESLPLTPPEWLEWGDPIRDVEAFERIRGYSPYDNVRAQDYPAILALAGLTDPRVTYWEPAKWVARLRALMTGGGPILLKTNMEAGHGGAAGRFDQLEDIALAYSFALAVVSGEL
jgi:oligopeptidase B